MTTEPKPKGSASGASIPSMPEVEKSEATGNLVMQMYCSALESWGRAAQAEISSLASRLEAAQAKIAKDKEATAERVRQINRLKEKLRNPEKRFADLQALAGGLAEEAERAAIACSQGDIRIAQDILNAALAKFHSSRPQA